jgi:hypothetical protein
MIYTHIFCSNLSLSAYYIYYLPMIYIKTWWYTDIFLSHLASVLLLYIYLSSYDIYIYILYPAHRRYTNTRMYIYFSYTYTRTYIHTHTHTIIYPTMIQPYHALIWFFACAVFLNKFSWSGSKGMMIVYRCTHVRVCMRKFMHDDCVYMHVRVYTYTNIWTQTCMWLIT